MHSFIPSTFELLRDCDPTTCAQPVPPFSQARTHRSVTAFCSPTPFTSPALLCPLSDLMVDPSFPDGAWRTWATRPWKQARFSDLRAPNVSTLERVQNEGWFLLGCISLNFADISYPTLKQADPWLESWWLVVCASGEVGASTGFRDAEGHNFSTNAGRSLIFAALYQRELR